MMKSLSDYIFESGNDIKFVIWNNEGKRVNTLNINDKHDYTKIEYTYKNLDQHLNISFLIGLNEDDKWCLWCGPLGKSSYTKPSLYNLETKSFKGALIASKPYIEDFIDKVKNNKKKYIMYYQ